jgi:hypothetical protein
MNSFLTFVSGEGADSSPNWFDYFTLIITSLISIFSVLGGYKIARTIYKSEQNDKLLEDMMLQTTEVNLFKNSLSQLKTSVDKQVEALKRYDSERNFTIQFVQGLDTTIFNYIQIRHLYLDIGFSNSEKINRLNELIGLISSLQKFSLNLRDEFRAYMDKYSFHEQKRYQYRQLLYTKFFELYNERSVSVEVDENSGRKKFTFSTQDIFIKKYNDLINTVQNDQEVIFDGSLKSIDLLIVRFIVPLIHLSNEYVPEDIHAIQILEISNAVNTAHKDIENITNVHFTSVNTYLQLLENISGKIQEYSSIA